MQIIYKCSGVRWQLDNCSFLLIAFTWKTNYESSVQYQHDIYVKWGKDNYKDQFDVGIKSATLFCDLLFTDLGFINVLSYK